MGRISFVAVVMCGLFAVGCSHGVTRGVRTTPRAGGPAASGAMVVGRMGRPPLIVGLVGPPGVAPPPVLSPDTGVRRLDRAERELFDRFDRSGMMSRTLAEADLGPAGAPDAGFYVTVNITNYSEHFEGPDGRYWAGFVVGSFTMIGYLLMIDSHANSQHTFDFEVRVYDVRGAGLVRSTDERGAIVNRYDTSVAAPLLRRTYSGRMHSWIGAGTTGPTGGDLDTFVQTQAEEIADVIFDACAEDVARAIRNAPPPTPALPAVPMGTGEVMPSADVRAVTPATP